MQQSVMPQTAQVAVLNSLTAMGGLFNGANVHLFQNPVVPTAQSQLADFTEANFVGYAVQPVGTWLSAGIDPTGEVSVQAATLEFSATATTTPNTIHGYYLTDSTNTTLLLAVAFDAPVVMGVDTITVCRVDATYGYGDVIPDTSAIAILDSLKTMTGLLHGTKTRLYANAATPNPQTLLADLVEATYTGYAAQTNATFLPAGLDQDGNDSLQAQSLQFAATGTAASNTVYGLYVTDSAGTVLYFLQAFDAPIVLGVDTISIANVDPTLAWGS